MVIRQNEKAAACRFLSNLLLLLLLLCGSLEVSEAMSSSSSDNKKDGPVEKKARAEHDPPPQPQRHVETLALIPKYPQHLHQEPPPEPIDPVVPNMPPPIEDVIPNMPQLPVETLAALIPNINQMEIHQLCVKTLTPSDKNQLLFVGRNLDFFWNFASGGNAPGTVPVTLHMPGKNAVKKGLTIARYRTANPYLNWKKFAGANTEIVTGVTVACWYYYDNGLHLIIAPQPQP